MAVGVGDGVIETVPDPPSLLPPLPLLPEGRVTVTAEVNALVLLASWKTTLPVPALTPVSVHESVEVPPAAVVTLPLEAVGVLTRAEL